MATGRENIDVGLSQDNFVAKLNTNFDGIQDLLSKIIMGTLITSSDIDDINDNIDLINSNCSLSMPHVTAGMTGSAFRGALNLLFITAFSCDTINLYDSYFKMQFTYSGTQISIKMTVNTGKSVKVSWGDNNVTTVTADGTEKTITSNYLTNGTYKLLIMEEIGEITSLNINNTTAVYDITEFNKFSGLEVLNINSRNGYGDFSDFHPTSLVTAYIFYGTYSGACDNLPETLIFISFSDAYLETLMSGTIEELPTSLEDFNWTGNEHFTGSLDNYPVNLKSYCHLNLTLANGGVTGSLNSLKTRCPDMTYFSAAYIGDDITGSLNSLPVGLTTFSLNNVGAANITGDIKNISNVLVTFGMQNMGSLITGNIEELPTSVNDITVVNTPNIIYGGGSIPSWVLNSDGIAIDNDWTSTMVDNFLIACALGLPHSSITPRIKLDYTGMGARTAASDAAVATLTTNHYVVTTN